MGMLTPTYQCVLGSGELDSESGDADSVSTSVTLWENYSPLLCLNFSLDKWRQCRGEAEGELYLSRKLAWFGASHKSELDKLWLRNRNKNNIEAVPGLMKPCVLIKPRPAGDFSG